MMNPEDNGVFLDTNILVYANVDSAPLHKTALDRIQQLWDDGNDLWISQQVMREFLAVLTRPQTFSQPQPVSVVVERVHWFQEHFHIAGEGGLVTENLLDLVTKLNVRGKQVHDANIVATMQVQGISQLLTHNVADFNRYAHLITVISLTN